MRKKVDVLFILKRREDYSTVIHSARGLSTGLYNSAKFMVDMLNESGISSELEIAVDNNCIDRLVTKHKPKYVIIEAFWVVPSKFSVLCKLHPNVKWIVRIHSEMPFMANEGMAMDWMGGYSSYKNVVLAPNAPRMLEEVRTYIQTRNSMTREHVEKKVIYLPNSYPKEYRDKKFNRKKHYVDVGCFGAVRPLKNHLLQAVAALKFAQKNDKKLRFHINGGRVENKGDPVMHNLRGMFENLYDRGHRLVLHTWTPREEFLKLCGKMDVGMQVSFSETFNIVGADFISQGVPLVGDHDEIPWMSSLFSADAQDCDGIAKALDRAYHMNKINLILNRYGLDRYRDKTKQIWIKYFTG